MEDKGVAAGAIESANRWLSSAALNAREGNYDSALYSLETSVEIALKAVLYALKAEVPRTHNMGDVMANVIRSGKRVPDGFKESLDNTITTFNALLELRSASVYPFESGMSMKELKGRYEKHHEKAEGIVRICGAAVRDIERHGRKR